MAYRDVEKMTDAEFETLTREIAGEQVKIPEIAFDSRYMEKRDNPTPSGGDYSIAYYYDEEGSLCEKQKATRVNIVEYRKGGERVNEHYALLVNA